MSFDNVCKNDEPFTIEEKYVLGIAKPDDYTEAMITVLTIAITKHQGYAVQLAKIHPELAHAVNCLINGNLQEVYRQRQLVTKELIRQMGY